MLTLLAVSAFALKFPGGGPNAFAAALAAGTQQNVLICQGEAQNVAKVAFENAGLTEMARAIRAQADHAIMPGAEMILSDQKLAMDLVTGGGFERPAHGMAPVLYPPFESIQYPTVKVIPLAIDFIPLPASAVKDGLVSFKTSESEGLWLKTLGNPFSKPVKYHWIYEEMPLFVQVKGMPELEFLKWMAKGLGARLEFRGKEYDFQLDPFAIRNRAIATMRKLAAPFAKEKGYSHSRESYAFRIACLNALSPAQIAAAVETPYSSVKVEIKPGTSLVNVVIGRIRELEAYQKTFGPNTRAHKNAIGLLPKVDPDRPAYLIMDAKFYTRLQIPTLDEKGQPAGVVDIS